ncbi:helix-turn-helix transcriptional regulator [Tsukamurella sp. 8F]|uniref:helix-turn-helix domain-containing protein n=1 Tax=unclassified Tsukamurella TaxID=2633480 RepID=UPI0023B988B1|nr:MULTISPECIES: helix-turn-helix transcriptional regulator [unclassified Tsukamurella]MDF0529003.1 helix-turn-helix transcriptional regulator [Tsukamurella sp. 8J]MDF0587376.1 helix-turn-helix transcriptional regulator [Tsukamurella sp. 8F]
MDDASILANVGPRLRAVRQERDITLTAVADATGISVSTLSRLEGGERKPTLELLLPLARAYGMPLDELVDAPDVGDPRVRLKPQRHGSTTIVPLTRRAGGLRSFKVVLGPRRNEVPQPRSHEGYHWLYVLDGRLRLILGERDLVIAPGEVIEFDTRLPHWFGCADDRPVEYLAIYGPQGEKAHHVG